MNICVENTSKIPPGMVEKAKVYCRMLQREPGGASLCCTPSSQDLQLNFVTLKQFPDVLLALGRFFNGPTKGH